MTMMMICHVLIARMVIMVMMGTMTITSASSLGTTEDEKGSGPTWISRIITHRTRKKARKTGGIQIPPGKNDIDHAGHTNQRTYCPDWSTS